MKRERKKRTLNMQVEREKGRQNLTVDKPSDKERQRAKSQTWNR